MGSGPGAERGGGWDALPPSGAGALRGAGGAERAERDRACAAGPGAGSGHGERERSGRGARRPARTLRCTHPRKTRAKRCWSRAVTVSIPGAHGVRPRRSGGAGGGPKLSPGGRGRPRPSLHGGPGAGKVLCAIPALGGMGSAGKPGGIAFPSSVSRCGSITAYRAQQKEITVCWPCLSGLFSRLVAVICFLFKNTNLSILEMLLSSFQLCRYGFDEFSLSCWLIRGRLALVVGHSGAGILCCC